MIALLALLSLGLGTALVFEVFQRRSEARSRRRVERELAHSSARLREAQAAARTGTWEWSVTDGELWWSEEMYRLFHLSPGWAGRSFDAFLERVHPEDRERVGQQVREHLGSGSSRVFEMEFRIYLPNGEVRHIFGRGQPQQDPQGNTTGLIGAVHDVTDRVRAGISRLESEALMHRIVDAVPHRVAVRNREGRFLFANRAVAEESGRDVSWIVGHLLSELHEGLSQQEVEGRLREDREVIDSGKEKFIPEVRSKDANGQVHILQSHRIPLEFAGESAVLEVALDISDQKHAAAELDRAQSLLMAAIEACPAGVIVADMPGHRIRIANSAAFRIRGKSPSSAAEGPIEPHFFPWNVARPDGVPVLPDEMGLRRAIREGRTIRNQEVVVRNEDGATHHLLTNSAPVRGASGEIIAGVDVFLDVSAAKRAEQALRESEERFRLLLESTAEAIYGLDLEGRCTFVNPACLKLLGYASGDDLLGRDMHALIHHTRADGTPNPAGACKISASFRSGEGTHVEGEPLWRADGRSFPAEYWSYPIRSSGKLTGSVVTFLDISQRVRSETELSRYRGQLETLVAQRTAELETSRQQLQRSERMATVGTLAAGIAHEINNPVGAILLSAQSALASRKRPFESLEMIVDEARRCGRIMRSILQFSAQRVTEKWPNDLGSVVQRAVQLMRRTVGDRSASIALESGSGSLQARINPIAIEQLIVILVQNALDAGARSVKIRVRSEQETVQIQVEDDGRGFPGEVAGRIFDPFFTTRRQSGGTGLGLSIAYGIVSDHEGTMQAYSHHGSGALFTVELPVSPGAAARDSVPAA